MGKNPGSVFSDLCLAFLDYENTHLALCSSRIHVVQISKSFKQKSGTHAQF